MLRHCIVAVLLLPPNLILMRDALLCSPSSYCLEMVDDLRASAKLAETKPTVFIQQ